MNLKGENGEDVSNGLGSGSPVDRSSRRQWRREKEKQGMKRWETQHFLKIVDSSSMPDRPLQGLWKGICDDMKLVFYLVTYDGVGISCEGLGTCLNRILV